jgi:hypothetical protein
MGEFRGTPEDLVRLEVCHAVEDWCGIRFTDGDVDGWRTVGDLHRSIIARSTAPLDPAAAWSRLRDLLAGGYGVAPGQVFPEAELFGDPLWLQDRGVPRWGTPAPEPPADRPSQT